MVFVYDIVHYDGPMNECPIEEVTFTSRTPKVVALKRGITLQRMKEVILRKLHKEAQERVATMHFRYPTRLGGEVSHYTTIEMTEDDDVQVLFGIYDSIKLQTGPELYVTFQRFASSSTQSQPTSLPFFHYEQSEVPPPGDHQSQLLSHQTPYPLTFDLNEPPISILGTGKTRSNHILNY